MESFMIFRTYLIGTRCSFPCVLTILIILPLTKEINWSATSRNMRSTLERSSIPWNFHFPRPESSEKRYPECSTLHDDDAKAREKTYGNCNFHELGES